MATRPVHLRERFEEVLRHLESGDLVLLLDFDGTLAPIVARAEDAAALPGAREAVLALAGAGVRVAVISGRGLADVRGRLGIEALHYAGNHGLEIEGPDLRRTHPEAEVARSALADVRRRLEEELREIPGAWVEDKRLSLSVHFRQTPVERHAEVERRVDRVARVPGLQVRPGKRVWEVRPDVDWHKGRAVEFLLATWEAEDAWPMYVGDDATDEDAFRAVRGRGLGVKVGPEPGEETAAEAWLRDPVEVRDFLARLSGEIEP